MSTKSSSKRLVVDIISDTVCPWCFVGKRRLEQAVKTLPEGINLEVRWHPFFLHAPLPSSGISKRAYYTDKFGEERTEQWQPEMEAMFRDNGISDGKYSIDGILANTLDSHRLLDYAQEKGLQNEVSEAIFQAYFLQGRNIGNKGTLASIANEVGVKDAWQFLTSDGHAESVRATAAANAARQPAINIPYFTFSLVDDSAAAGEREGGAQSSKCLQGAVEVEQIEQVLEDLVQEVDVAKPASDADTAGGCARVPGGGSECVPMGMAVPASATLPTDPQENGEDMLPLVLGLDGFPDEVPFEEEHFSRLDTSVDTAFYAEPRMVHHIDDGAREALTKHYRATFSRLCAASSQPLNVLDLCSSWTSHFPGDPASIDEQAGEETFSLGRVVGLGMNVPELEANPCLTEHALQDLNARPDLGQFGDGEFDVVSMALSIDYLTEPIRVLSEARRVLRPGGECVVSFSDRLFPSKAIAVWRDSNSNTRLWLAASFFHYAGEWEDLKVLQLPTPTDPLFVVRASKPTTSI